MKGVLFALAVIGTSISFAEAADFSAKWEHDNLFPDKYKMITVTARSDATITGISLNRGSCKIFSVNWPKLPVKVKFGQTMKIRTLVMCDIIELQIKSSDGITTIQW